MQEQSYPNLEIIIVDDGSLDKTREIIKKFKKVKLIEGEHKGPGFSRNLGAEFAKGEILVFVDADMAFEKDYVKKLIAPIIDKECIGTENSRQIASNEENIWSRCWGLYSSSEKDKNKEPLGWIFRAILKKEFIKMGGFNPKYGYADDLTFFYKYGIRSKRVEAICYHENPASLKEVYKQSRWIGASVKIPGIDTPIKYLIPLALAIASPLAIIYFALNKAMKKNSWSIFFPWMIIFMTWRYFGTFSGIIRRVFLNKNFR